MGRAGTSNGIQQVRASRALLNDRGLFDFLLRVRQIMIQPDSFPERTRLQLEEMTGSALKNTIRREGSVFNGRIFFRPGPPLRLTQSRQGARTCIAWEESVRYDR